MLKCKANLLPCLTGELHVRLNRGQPCFSQMPIKALIYHAKQKGPACAHETLAAYYVYAGRGAAFVQRAAAPCKQAPFPSPLAIAELHLPPWRALTNPLHLCGCCWLRLSRASRDGVLGTASAAPPAFTLFIPCFCPFFCCCCFISWGDICHFN